MKQTPCEYILWCGLPTIRKEFAIRMVKDYGLSYSETAKKLGISVAAVSHYISGKRANKNINDSEVCKEISKSVYQIIENGDKAIISEICRICKIFSSKNIFPNICQHNKN
jgi:predicted transcriptional regulator